MRPLQIVIRAGLLSLLLVAPAGADPRPAADPPVRAAGEIPDEDADLPLLLQRLDTLVRSSLNTLYLNVDGDCEVRRLADEVKTLASRTRALRDHVLAGDLTPSRKRLLWRDVVAGLSSVRFMIDEPAQACARESGFLAPYTRIRSLEMLIFQRLMAGH